MFGLINRGELEPVTEHEFEQLNARLKQLWLEEHNEDGTHRNVFKDALPDAVAYEDELNQFTEDIEILDGHSLRLRHAAEQSTRVSTQAFTDNVSLSGANWNLDDTGQTGVAVRINTGGALTVSGFTAGANPRSPVSLLTLSAAGLLTLPVGQLQFPASQNPSADVNTLDDYEEGGWTPTVTPQTSGSVTYTSQLGRYVKIGRWVMVTGYVVINTVSSPVGTIRIGGLPFVPSANSEASAVVQPNNAAAGWTVPWAHVNAGVGAIEAYQYSAGTVAAAAGFLQAGTDMRISAVYEATA